MDAVEYLQKQINNLQEQLDELKTQELNRVSRLNIGLTGSAAAVNTLTVDSSILVEKNAASPSITIKRTDGASSVLIGGASTGVVGTTTNHDLLFYANNAERARVTAAGDLYSVAWTDYSATSTITGWSSFLYKKLWYKQVGKLVFVVFYIGGTSDTTGASFTLPLAIEAASDAYTQTLSINIIDNGANQYHPGLLYMTGVTAIILRDPVSGLFTASGAKYTIGQFWYQAA